jgi:Ion transport protein
MQQKEVLKNQTDLAVVEKIVAPKKVNNIFVRVFGPIFQSIPTGTMVLSAVSSFVYILSTATIQKYRPPESTSSIHLIAIIPLLGLLHFTKSLESLTRYILQTFKPLLQISLVLIFILAVYSLTGIKLFGHAVDRRCRKDYLPTGSNWDLFPGTENRLCGYNKCPEGGFCRAWFNLKDEYPHLYELRPKEILTSLRQNSELNYGFSNFNNFINAMTTNLIIVAGDDWSNILYIVS